jgi:MFS family permease
MAIYTVMLSIGSALGVVFDGLVTISLTWQYMYYIGIALIGFCTILVFLFFPETSYNRVIINKTITVNEKHTVNGGLENGASSTPPKRPYKDNLRVFTGTYTKESLLKMFLRPLGLIIIPPVLWASLVQAVTIGFLVAVSTNLAPAYAQVYGFVGWQTGLCNLAAVIGSLCAIPFGGYFSDKVADYFTKRNGGIREPEHRLPAIIPALITGPLSLILYGLGINNQYHWIVPTIGLGLSNSLSIIANLVNFTIVAGNNVVLVYCVDAYRPIAGEVVITQLGFKGLFGFLLSFYTNPWVTNSGYLKAFGGMAGISGAVIIWFIPLFFYGRRIRHAVYQWKILQWVKWDDDREKGE